MEQKKLGWLRILLFIMPYLLIAGSTSLLLSHLSGIDFQSPDKTYFERFWMKFYELIGTFVTLVIFMNYVDKRPFIALGFSFRNRKKELITGILLGLVIMAFAFILLLLANQITYEGISIDLSSALASILLFAAVSVGEEVVLRGYVLRNLMLSFNKYTALIVSSVLFAAMHGFNPNLDDLGLLNLFLAGILLGASYIYTKNLWFPIGLHFSWNLFQSFFGFHVSGQNFYSIFKIEITQENMYNGGAFGFEGSVLAVCIQLVAIGFIFNYYRNHQQTKSENDYNSI